MTSKLNTWFKNLTCEFQKLTVIRFFMGHWAAAAFSAAMTIVLEHLGYLQLFTKLSWLVLFSLPTTGAQTPVSFQSGMPAVVLIQEADFVTRYGEKTPLDRCVLAGDIQRVLAKSPQRLAVDFDLSPMMGNNAMDVQCQARLDSLLDENSERLIALVPFATSNPALREKKHAWMNARCQAGLAFADGRLDAAMGIVTEHDVGEGDDLKARIAEQMREGPSAYICTQVQSASTPEANPWLNEQRSTSDAAIHHESAPLHFRSAIHQLAVIPLDGDTFERLPSLQDSPVLLGGDWGRDDSFLTGIGEQAGAVVHGVRIVNLKEPVKAPSPLFAFLLDMGIAMGFAWLVNYFWSTYVDWRKLDHHFHGNGHKVALGALILVLFVVAYLGLTLFFIFSAHYLLETQGLVIAPILIAVSMLLDGFVSGPVEKLNELLEEESENAWRHRSLDLEEALPEEITRVMNNILCMLGMGVWVVLLAWFWGAQALTHLSGLIFESLMIIFYLALLVQVFAYVYQPQLRLKDAQGRAGHKNPHPSHADTQDANEKSGTHSHASKAGRIFGRPKKMKDLMAIGKVFSVLKTCAFWAVLVAATYLQTFGH
ncbi:hypothetical protein B9Z51_12150 [Limnohabitans sp. T6-5]|uniref:hypothetical protein n=1 Tax=Limnohabitans sp. T6-5 TaxID=1100724 RepID=UPI000D3661EE|nr:hypothetical protein [Limnohabitans sp. T6-5]PUE06697.1 hypothetical protein B9Z51_12150 [Limnohabitans sp. T6-5]